MQPSNNPGERSDEPAGSAATPVSMRFRLGIPLFDEKLAGVSSVLLLGASGVDPAPYGVHLLIAALCGGARAVYFSNNKPSSVVRAEATAQGLDLAAAENEGRLVLADAFSGAMGLPGGDDVAVDRACGNGIVDLVVSRFQGTRPMVLLDSLSSRMDMRGSGPEDVLPIVDRLRKASFPICLFSTWGFTDENINTFRDAFDTVFRVEFLSELSAHGHLLTVEKAAGHPVGDLAAPVKLLHPGGLRVYIPKVVVTGPRNAGKSALVRALSRTSTSVDRMGMTVALDHGTIDYRGVSVELYGTPGHHSFDPLLATIADEALAVVLVVDATAPETFPRAGEMLNLSGSKGLPTVVAANHSDREGALTPGQVRNELGLGPGVPVVPTAAPGGKGLRELLDALVVCLLDPAALLRRKRASHSSLRPSGGRNI